MKKFLFTALVALTAALSYSDVPDSSNYQYVDKYDFNMSVKVPVVGAGVRDYSTYKFKGHVYICWADDETTTPEVFFNVYQAKDKKKAIVNFEVTGGFINRLGKKFTKPSAKLTVKCEDCGLDLTLAGYGSTKTKKGSGCGPCGTGTANCVKIAKLSGGVTGDADCFCGENSPTRASTACGTGDVDTLGAVYGTWSIKLSKK